MFSSIAWMTVMPFAFLTRSRTELNLEILAVAAMVASSSWPWRRRAAAVGDRPLDSPPSRPALRLSSTSPARPPVRPPSRPAACCCIRSPPFRSRSPFSPPCRLRSRSPFSPPARLRLRSPLCPASVRDDEIDLGRPWASWPSFCCGTPPAAPRSPRRREGARGAARSSGSTACPCQRR